MNLPEYAKLTRVKETTAYFDTEHENVGWADPRDANAKIVWVDVKDVDFQTFIAASNKKYRRLDELIQHNESLQNTIGAHDIIDMWMWTRGCLFPIMKAWVKIDMKKTRRRTAK